MSGRPTCLDLLNDWPPTSLAFRSYALARVAERYRVTHQAAMNALRRLERLGLLTAETAHGRVTFRADDVVHLLEQ